MLLGVLFANKFNNFVVAYIVLNALDGFFSTFSPESWKEFFEGFLFGFCSVGIDVQFFMFGYAFQVLCFL